jgi:hypothetical protein
MISNYLTITPISKNQKSKANIDFREQLMRTATGELNWCWDDSKYNTAKPGEYFAFFHHKDRVVIHRIVAVKPPSERLPSWTANVGQTTRNVLELSEPLKELSWSEWIQTGCSHVCMGTYRTTDLLEDSSRWKMYKILQELTQREI